MTTAMSKVKKGMIRLPGELQAAWERADVYITGNRDMITLKRLSKPSLSLREMMDAFRSAAKRTKLTRTEVLKEIEAVRKEKN